MDAAFASALFDEMEKIALSKRDKADLAAGGAAAGGAVALNEAIPKITGRTAVYHGTTADAAKRIRAEGLNPANRGGMAGVIEKGGFPAEWGNKAYVSKRPSRAAGYAFQSTLMRGEAPSVLRMSIPEWKKGVHGLEANPEFAGGFRAWRRRTLEAVPERMGHLPESVQRVSRALIGGPIGALGYLSQGVAGREFAVNRVAPEHIKGSLAYKGLSLKELGQYIRSRPGRFAAGLGLGAAGLAGIGYGGRRLVQRLRGDGS